MTNASGFDEPWQIHPDSQTPINDLDAKQEAMKRIERQEKIKQFEKKVTEENIEFSRKPAWVQQNEAGDRMADGSDDQPYDDEPEEETQ